MEVISGFLSGYFIWFAEETISTKETTRQEDGNEGGGDVSHPGGRQALGVLWILFSTAYSWKKLSCQVNILQPAQPPEHWQPCICYRGLAWFTLFLCCVLLIWLSYVKDHRN